jgi:hypothetical protein
MATAPFAFTRRFFEDEETIISSCNYCFLPIGESSHEAELEALEQLHTCAKMLLLGSTDDEEDRATTFADYSERSLASLST